MLGPHLSTADPTTIQRAPVAFRSSSVFNSLSRCVLRFSPLHRSSTLAFALLLLAACEQARKSEESAGEPDGWVDLIADFELARLQSEVSLIDVGTSTARRHLIAGWGADEHDQTESFVWATPPESKLEFFVSSPRKLKIGLQCNALPREDADGQMMTVELNQHVLGRFEVTPGRRTYSVDAEASTVRLGTNTLTFRYSRSDVPSQLFADSPDDRELAVQWYSIHLRGLEPAPPPSSEGGQLLIPGGSSASLTYRPPPGSVLLLDQLTSHRSQLHVKLTSPDHSSSKVLLDGDHRLELPAEPVRIELTAMPEASLLGRLGWSRKSSLQIGRAVIRAPRTNSEGPKEVPSPARPHPNILIYLVDTLRADRLGVYGYQRGLTPAIDRFAEDGVVFDNARAQSSWTRTAVASLLTGQLPHSHGVQNTNQSIDPSTPILAAILSGLQYRTAGVTTNGNISANFGFDRGFDQYIYLNESTDDPRIHQTAEQVNEAAFPLLQELSAAPPTSPALLYLHATDPHAPYLPPPEFAARFAPDVPRAAGEMSRVKDLVSARVTLPEETVDYPSLLYDAEIAYLDSQFDLLIEELRELDLYDEMMIIFVADHGEEFLDHSNWGHGHTLFSEQLNIPLIIKLPNGEFAGRRVESIARQIDVLPTILDYLGVAQLTSLDGTSLLPRIHHEQAAEESPTSIASLRRDHFFIDSLEYEHWKVIVEKAGNSTVGQTRFFELREDPTEQIDLSTRNRIEMEWLRQKLERLQPRATEREGVEVEMSADVRERLEALGYL